MVTLLGCSYFFLVIPIAIMKVKRKWKIDCFMEWYGKYSIQMCLAWEIMTALEEVFAGFLKCGFTGHRSFSTGRSNGKSHGYEKFYDQTVRESQNLGQNLENFLASWYYWGYIIFRTNIQLHSLYRLNAFFKSKCFSAPLIHSFQSSIC